MLLDKVLIFSKQCSKTYPLRVIGLTATTSKEFLDYEANYLSQIGFDIFDSKIKASFDTPPVEADWDVIFGRECDGMARLIFTEEDKVEGLIMKARKIMIDPVGAYKTNQKQLNEIRNMSPNSVNFVTDPVLMRGYDYQCKTGIALVIDRKLISKRDYMQALGRCQRYQASRDKRFHHISLGDPIDTEKAFALVHTVS